MLTLSHIFLSNWHHITHRLVQVISVDRQVRLTGCYKEDWDALLDGIRLVFLAHAQHTLSANQSEGAISYILVECAEPEHVFWTTFGTCVEHAENGSPQYTFFIIPDRLDTELVIQTGQPLTSLELKQKLYAVPDTHTFDDIEEYKTHLLIWLGGLNPRFFDLFARAMIFDIPCDVHQFVNEWLLEAHPINTETLKHIIEPYGQLSNSARSFDAQLVALQAIIEQQTEVCRLQQQCEHYRFLTALLQCAATKHHIAHHQNHLEELNQQMMHHREELEVVRATLNNTQRLWLETEIRMAQTDSKRAYDDLQRDMKQVNSDATIIQARWLALLHDLKQEEGIFRALLQDATKPSIKQNSETFVCLTDEEQDVLRSLLNGLALLAPDKPPPRPFARIVDSAIHVLDSAWLRMQEYAMQTKLAMKELQQRGNERYHQKELLRKGKLWYPAHIQRVCELLSHMLGERPSLLCEVIEILNERWQNSIEAILGNQRFILLVDAAQRDAVLRVLQQARINEQIYDIGVLDMTKLLPKSSPPLPGSLVHQVQVLLPAIQPYMETLLGTIMPCENVEQLKHHDNAITPDVVFRQNGVIRILSPDHYRPWYIGTIAQRSHIAWCERELLTIGNHITTLTQQVDYLQTQIERLRHVRHLSNLRQRMDQPLDERPLRSHIADMIARQKSLHTSEMETLLQETTQLQERIHGARETEHRLIANIAICEVDRERTENEIQQLQIVLAEQEELVNTISFKYAQTKGNVEQKYQEHLAAIERSEDKPAAYAQVIRKSKEALLYSETHLSAAIRKLTHDTATYNARYGFAAQTGECDEQRYQQERQRLIGTNVSRYQEQIESAKRETTQGVCKHIISHLRDRIMTVKQQLRRFNEILMRLELHGTHYRFRHQLYDPLIPFYDLITGPSTLDPELLLTSEIAPNHQTVFNNLLTILTSTSETEEEHHLREAILDYRAYFTYEIELVQADGNTAPAERMDVPFFLIIAASFARLYRVSEHNTTSTLRLVVFNTTWEHMQQEQVATILNLFHSLGLQVMISGTILPSLPTLEDMDIDHHEKDPHPATQ